MSSRKRKISTGRSKSKSDENLDSVDSIPYGIKKHEVESAVPKFSKSSSTSSVDDANTIQSFQLPNSPSYRMNKKGKRLAIIYNHKKFPKLDERHGTDEDVKRLQKLLPLLNYEVIVKNDLSTTEMVASVGDIRNQNHKLLEESDSIMVVILTHGAGDNKLMANDCEYDLFEFVKHFTPKVFPTLATKPKLFFVQACRGNSIDKGVKIKEGFDSVDGTRFGTPKPIQTYTHPIFADLFIAFSSHHQHFCYRNIEGSWFIQELCNSLEKILSKRKSEDLFQIMALTGSAISKRNAISNNEQHDKAKQICASYTTLIRQFYFK